MTCTNCGKNTGGITGDHTSQLCGLCHGLLDALPLADQTARRILLEGLDSDPALQRIRDWNSAVHAREGR